MSQSSNTGQQKQLFSTHLREMSLTMEVTFVVYRFDQIRTNIKLGNITINYTTIFDG